MIEQRAVLRLGRVQFVEQLGQTLAEHQIAQAEGLRVGVVDAAIAGSLVVQIVGAADRSAASLGPRLVLFEVGSPFAAEDLRDDARHVGLERQRDQLEHQFDVLAHAALARWR